MARQSVAETSAVTSSGGGPDPVTGLSRDPEPVLDPLVESKASIVAHHLAGVDADRLKAIYEKVDKSLKANVPPA